jgi:hypothetical protein
MFINTAHVPESDLKLYTKSNETKISSSPSKPPHSKHPYNSLSRFCSSLLIQIKALQLLVHFTSDSQQDHQV